MHSSRVWGVSCMWEVDIKILLNCLEFSFFFNYSYLYLVALLTPCQMAGVQLLNHFG